jgi:hypothetical protein
MVAFPFNACSFTGSSRFGATSQDPSFLSLLSLDVSKPPNLSPPAESLSLFNSDGGVFDTQPYKAEAIAFATKKQLTPHWHQIFLRGIGCNWLVCLACFFGAQGRELVSKIVGIWWPIFAFVSLGLDHVVANM